MQWKENMSSDRKKIVNNPFKDDLMTSCHYYMLSCYNFIIIICHRAITTYPATLPTPGWVVSGGQPGSAGRALPLSSYCHSQGVGTFRQAEFPGSCFSCKKLQNVPLGVASNLDLQLRLSDAKWRASGCVDEWTAGDLSKQAFGREQSPPLEKRNILPLTAERKVLSQKK